MSLPFTSSRDSLARLRRLLGTTVRAVLLLLLCCDGDDGFHLEFTLLSPDGNSENVRATAFVSPLARADVDGDGVDELLWSSSGGLSFTTATGENGELVAWPGIREPRWIGLVGEQAELVFLDDQDRLVTVRCEQREPSSCDVEGSVPAPDADEFVVADFDEDGLLDAAVLSSKHDLQFLFGLVEAERVAAQGGGEEWATVSRAQLAVGDLDGDGHDDLVELGRELTILFGDGEGSFPVTKTIQLPAKRYVRRVALAELADGLVHIVTDQAVFVNLGNREFDDGNSAPYGDNDLFLVGDFS